MIDVVVVGGGFAGTLTAWALHRAGARVRLVEQGHHPRFTIGEATTPSASLLLEQFAARWDLSALEPLARYGTWKAAYPDLPCGLKRGFSFLDQDAGRLPTGTPTDRLIVAASPSDARSDTNWLRSEVDAFLVAAAQGENLDYSGGTNVEIRGVENGFFRLGLERSGRTEDVRARFVVDAGGRNGFATSTGLVERIDGTAYDFGRTTRTIYGHFEGVRRIDTTEHAHDWTKGPHGDDDAALHHLFPGGWAWVLRFDTGVTSIGLVLDEEEPGGETRPPSVVWDEALTRAPLLAHQLENAVPTQPIRSDAPVAWSSRNFTGDRFALLPGAAAFVGPMFSTGISLSLAGVARLTEILEESLGGNESSLAPGLEQYGEILEAELKHVSGLIDLTWKAKPSFPLFVAATKLYFAGASMWEGQTRLGKGGPWKGLYLADDPEFKRACKAARAAITGVIDPATRESPLSLGDAETIVADSIAPFDIAGLNRPELQGLHGVDAADLLAGSSLLGLSEADLRDRLPLFGLEIDP